MKRTLVILFVLIILCCAFLGCQTSVPQDESESFSEGDGALTVDLGAVIGTTEYELITIDPDSQKNIIYHAQTNLGNLCADAYRSVTDADAAFVSAGEIGSGIAKGDITVADVLLVFPSESELVTVWATGAEILDCLEIAYSILPSASPDYMHLSGITLTLDLNKEGNGRVQNVQIGGAPLSLENTYTVTFSKGVSWQISDVFKDASTVAESTVSNRGALMSYVSDTLFGNVGEEYKNVFGNQRISVIPLGQTQLPSASGTLPQVYLTTKSTPTRREYVPCAVTVHDPTGVYRDVYDATSTVKIRGNSTSVGKKTPYNIKFSDKVELLGLGKGKKWCLLSNMYDKTQLRNMLAFNFAQTAGVNYISDCCFAEVYFNGEYCGLYQISEPVGVSKTRVDIDIANNEYLLEVEPYRGYKSSYCLITPQLGTILGYNEPEKPTSEQRAWLKTFMTDTVNAMMSGDYDKVKEYVDVDSFARCYIVQELFKNVDYLQSSTRFYVKGNKLYEGPVWDFDLSSGNCSMTYYDEYNNVETSGLSYEGIHCVGLFNEYLFEYKEFRQLVNELYIELQPAIVNLYRDNELGQNIIDSIVEANREGIERNNTLWSTKKRYSPYEHKPADGTYDGEITFLKEWLEKRNLWLYEYYCADMQ